jgi:branched-chain amino acid transport system substrate-binding protein
MRTRILVVLSAALIVAAGCGDDSEGGASRSDGDGNRTLLVGESVIRSGPNAGSHAVSQAFEAYLDYVNRQGGVNGYTFEWEALDNAYQASQAAIVQQQLLAKEPFAISVIGTVPVTSAVQVSLNQGSDAPLMLAADGGLVDKLAAESDVPMYGYSPDYAVLGPYDADFIIHELGDTNFALAYEDDALGQPASKAVAAYARENGAQLAVNLPVPNNTTNFTPIASRLRASGAETVLAFMNAGMTAGLQKAADKIGYSPTWVTPYFALSKGYLDQAGSVAEGTYIDSPLPPVEDDTEAMERFRTEVERYDPDSVTPAGAGGWQFAAIFVEGVRRATDGGAELTPAAFDEALSTLDADLELTHVSYSEDRHWALDQAAMYQVKDGKFVEVKPPSSLLDYEG